MDKNNPHVINAWCSYDIANSSYNLIITTVIFPLYYSVATRSAFGSDVVSLCGLSIKNSVIYDYVIAAAYMIVVFVSPLLSGIADYSSSRKRFMRFFTYMGSAVCGMLYFFNGQNIVFGLMMVALAVIGYAGSLVFYNSFLPIIATPDRHDKISARGFSWGYAGSVALLGICILIINTHQFWGFTTTTEAIRFSFLMVSVWWFGISHIAFFFLKEPKQKGKINRKIITKGYNELRNVFKSFSHKPQMYRFIAAFFFFSMGVQTVMLMATFYGSGEMHLTSKQLLPILIIIQLIGIIGAVFFAFVSKKYGNKISITIMLLIWIGICIAAYFITTVVQFYILAIFTGLVMGGIQSQSRSTYSKMIPQETIDTASYFSFYDITEKAAIVIGMFSFGLVHQLTGSMRQSALMLSVFFIIGLIIILTVKFKLNSQLSPQPFSSIARNGNKEM